MDYLNKPKKGHVIKKFIKALIVSIGILIAFFYVVATIKSTNEPEVLAHIKYMHSKIKQFKNLAGYYDLEKISNAYAYDHNMSEYSTTIYNCLGQLVWEKDEDFTIQKMIDWCMIDYKRGDKQVYYNTAQLMSGFSAWDGSYKRLEDVIKNNMNDADSYEHVKTSHRFVYYGTKRPHMVLHTTYRGKNAFGAKVLGEASAKIDALTYEGYDIEIK